MINDISWRRMLSSATFLVILVILLLFVVMYDVETDTTGVATPEQGIPFLWAIIFIHLPIVTVLVWKVAKSRHGRTKNTGSIVAAGLLTIFFGLLFLHAGFSFFGTGMDRTGIVLLFSSGCDIVAGILALIARIFYMDK